MPPPVAPEERVIARLGETLLRDFESVPIDVVARTYTDARHTVDELDVDPAHRFAVIDCLAREELRALSCAGPTAAPRPVPD